MAASDGEVATGVVGAGLSTRYCVGLQATGVGEPKEGNSGPGDGLGEALGHKRMIDRDSKGRGEVMGRSPLSKSIPTNIHYFSSVLNTWG